MKKCFLILTLILLGMPLLKADTVVLVPGFKVHGSSMLPLAHKFRKAGFGIYIWDYDARKYTVEGHAANLVCQLKEIAARKPCETIHFATHSVGGLIIRAALNHPECPEEAKMGRAVLIATPSRGSSIARRFSDNYLVQVGLGNKMGCQLMTWQPQDFDCLGAFPPCMEVLVIRGYKGVHLWFDGEPNDTLITINETMLNTPSYTRDFPFSHGNLLTCQPVMKVVTDFIICGPRK